MKAAIVANSSCAASTTRWPRKPQQKTAVAISRKPNETSALRAAAENEANAREGGDRPRCSGADHISRTSASTRPKPCGRERRYDEAIWYYERALARDPRNPVLLVDVARAYALRYRYADAEKLVELAESLYPRRRPSPGNARPFVRANPAVRPGDCLLPSRSLALSGRLARPSADIARTRENARATARSGGRQHVREEALALTPNFEEARYMLANYRTPRRQRGQRRNALAADHRNQESDATA